MHWRHERNRHRMTRSISRLELASSLAILLVASAIVVWFSAPMWRTQNLNDDAFITLTYAKSLAAGKGFVFNHPPATLGTTSPLMALSTAGLARLLPFLALPRVAILLSAAAWIGAGWLLFSLLLQVGLRPPLAAIAASLPLVMVQGWRFSLGMETWLFEFLLVLALVLHLRERPFLTGVCIAALSMTRGEGLLFGAILFGHDLVRRSRAVVGKVLGAAVPLGCWAVYAALTFGTVIPNTLYVKQFQASSSTDFITGMLGDLIPKYFSWFVTWDVWWANPYLGLAVLGLIFAVRRAGIMLVFVLWGVVYVGAYGILNPLPYWWYRQHVVFVLEVLAGTGVAWLCAACGGMRGVWSKLAGSLAVLVLVVVTFCPAWSVELAKSRNFSGDPRAPTYRAIAGWLNRNSRPEEDVAFIEVGYLGYYTSNRIVDLAGLTDREIAMNLEDGGYAWGFWRYEPVFYVHDKLFDWALGDIDPLEQGYVVVYEALRENASVPIYICRRAQ